MINCSEDIAISINKIVFKKYIIIWNYTPTGMSVIRVSYLHSI